MGCDIHAYIEYDKVRADGAIFVNHFGRVRPGRNYTLFALMAGVRYDENMMDGALPLFEPRGLPEHYSFFVEWDYGLVIKFGGGDGYCSPGDAAKWVAQGYSMWLNDDHTRVSNPDYHSASWLTAAELEQVQETYANIRMPDASGYTVKDGIREYVEVGKRRPAGEHLLLAAVISAMKTLDGDTPGRSRLVFWFDN